MLGNDDAIWIVNWITKRRPLFEEWGVHNKIAALVKNLHDGCWLAYDDLSTVVLCPGGVRQGCESGPMIFNSIYQLAREAVKDKLREEGIVMSLPSPSGELWERGTVEVTERERAQSVAHRNVEEILDVYFVDDGCYMIANKQATELVRRMRLLVATIVSIFSRFQLSVNMAKGKTEVMLALRGKNATAEREKLRGPDGLWLDIDDDDERQVHCKVHVVSEYKHLGSWGELATEMCERCQTQGRSGDGVVLATCCESVWQI